MHTIGIEKRETFKPSSEDKELYGQAGKAAFKMSKVIVADVLPKEKGGLYDKGKQWVNTFAGAKCAVSGQW